MYHSITFNFLRGNLMKLLGICGSPRKGATLKALETALSVTTSYPDIETELWSVRGKKIGPCIHCDACIRNNSMCIIDDDLKGFEELLLSADGIITASPVYDMTITAQLTMLFNRMRPMYLVHPGEMKNKLGGAIATGGTRHGGQEFTLQTIINFYLMHEMLATGGLGGCYNGGTIWSKDKKAAGAEKDKVGMETVIRLAHGVAEAMELTKHGREKWLEIKSNLNMEKQEASPIRDH